MMNWKPLSKITGVRKDDETKSFTATGGDIGHDSDTKDEWIRVNLAGLKPPGSISPVDSLWRLECHYATDSDIAGYNQCRYAMNTSTYVLFEVKK